MKSRTNDLATRFLLGELPEDERCQVELRFLSDNEFFEEVLSAEDALVDQYLLGLLGDEQRVRARNLLECTREQQLNVEFTRELIALIKESEISAALDLESSGANGGAEGQPVLAQHGPVYAKLMNTAPVANWMRLCFVALLVLLVSSILYLYSRERALEATHIAAEQRNKEITARISEEQQRSQDLARELESEQEQRIKAEEALAQSQPVRLAGMVSVLLFPSSMTRDGDSKIVKINTKSDRIRLQLSLANKPSYNEYSISITTFEGRGTWGPEYRKANEVKQGKLNLVLPSSVFSYDDYKIELKGRMNNSDFVSVADYTFKVRK